MSDTKQSERSVPIEDVGPQRETLLETLVLLEGEAHTPRLREADIPDGTALYHLGKLEEWGAIMRVGEERVGGGDKATVWAITDDGRDALEELRDRDETPPTVYELQRELEEKETRINELEETLDRVRAEFNKFAHVVEQHEKELGVIDRSELEELDGSE
ncbi:hypothetical protein GWG54_16120 [Natronococcus sp. JC468]|uniref:hypothetical protein n=1 Tax=Natronococcus sp. JC468 TaxID=1961921 RepID=UPI001438EA78|nr:hypothetical protein [Natronococcus sp. JC468]NKE37315.1 hypothetical protein [Natronococcus sp. JC468]